MKKIIIIMLLAVFSLGTVHADTQFITQGDTTIIIDGQDTVRFAGVNALTKRITDLLDDTILSIDEDGTVAEAETINSSIEAGERISHQWAEVASNIAAGFLVAVVFIVLFSLFFYYLHRRRKYKMVEKAIENNYPLPGYIFGAPNNEPSRQAYVSTPPPFKGNNPAGELRQTPDEMPQGAPQQQYQQPYQYQAPPMMVQDHINWHQMKDGFTLAVVGFGLMLFFLIVGSKTLSLLFLILIILGLGKMWANYQDQMNAIESWKNQQAWYNGAQQPQYQQPQSQQSQSQQPTPPTL